MKNKYGIAPDVMGNYPIECKEMMFYLYLPIKMKWSNIYQMPQNLEPFLPLLQKVRDEEGDALIDKYVYITAKHLFVTPDNLGNRAGWHSDGFGTEDINYIWTNNNPTTFCVQNFNLSKDCGKSMEQMEEQADIINERSFKNNDLMRLTEHQIHRTPTITKGCMRTFVKISISDHKYNLVGNSHNYFLDYDWEMFDRSVVRNHPTKKETDYVEEK